MWDALIRLAGKIAALLALIFSVRRAREKELRAEAAEHAAKVKDAQIDAAMDLPAAAMILLSACASTGFKPGAICPPLKDYAPAFNAALADAVAILPETSPIIIALDDYRILRAQVRACRIEK